MTLTRACNVVVALHDGHVDELWQETWMEEDPNRAVRYAAGLEKQLVKERTTTAITPPDDLRAQEAATRRLEAMP